MIYKSTPSIGLVISTYGSAPYVHLQLETIRRLLPSLAILVHDDYSQDPLLPLLCRQYGAFFQSNPTGLGFPIGDLTSFANGLRWAAKQRLDILVKFSRRFVPTYDWVTPLRELACENQCPTFSSICRNLNWGFRSEAVGMHVSSWADAGMIERIGMERQAPSVFVEHFIHQCARTVQESSNDEDVRTWHCSTSYPEYDGTFVMWSLLGQNRVEKVPGLLWHHSCLPSDYHAESEKLGLAYTLEDFDRPYDRLGH